MSYSLAERRAMLRGELRSRRYKYRHALEAVARKLGIPASWIKFWLSQGSLTARVLGTTWVRLEDVQRLLNDRQAVEDAFWETCDRVSSPVTARALLAKWPSLPRQICRMHHSLLKR